MTTKSSSKSKSSSGRELIDTGSDKRYVRRDSKGQFTEVDSAGRSLSQDIKSKAKSSVTICRETRGDDKRRK